MRRSPPTRQRGSLAPKRTILVYCGGTRTEPEYLDALRLQHRSNAVTVKILGYRDRHPDVYDEVWCVTDVDRFDLTRAVDLARREGVQLAVSNPCFELWLLLHHADCTSYCAGYPDVVSRLQRHVRDYDKTQLNFARYRDGVAAAIERARALDPSGREFTRNPSTNVWRLVERIREP